MPEMSMALIAVCLPIPYTPHPDLSPVERLFPCVNFDVLHSQEFGSGYRALRAWRHPCLTNADLKSAQERNALEPVRRHSRPRIYRRARAMLKDSAILVLYVAGRMELPLPRFTAIFQKQEARAWKEPSYESADEGRYQGVDPSPETGATGNDFGELGTG